MLRLLRVEIVEGGNPWLELPPSTISISISTFSTINILNNSTLHIHHILLLKEWFLEMLADGKNLGVVFRFAR